MKEANRDVLDRGSLPELLVQRARRASDKRLVVDAAVGLIAAALVATLRPPLWVPLAALGFALGAFGIWGILDREAADAALSGQHTRSVTLARAVIAILGVLAIALFAVTFFFSMLGPMIS